MRRQDSGNDPKDSPIHVPPIASPTSSNAAPPTSDVPQDPAEISAIQLNEVGVVVNEEEDLDDQRLRFNSSTPINDTEDTESNYDGQIVTTSVSVTVNATNDISNQSPSTGGGDLV